MDRSRNDAGPARHAANEQKSFVTLGRNPSSQTIQKDPECAGGESSREGTDASRTSHQYSSQHRDHNRGLKHRLARLEKILLDQRDSQMETAERLAGLENLLLDDGPAKFHNTCGRAVASSFEQVADNKWPVKFTDAFGRKHSFPFHLCNTWEVLCSEFPQFTNG